MGKKLISNQRDVNGNILVGNYVAHPQEFEIANRFLDHHYGKEGTENIDTLQKMMDTHVPDLHTQREKPDYHGSTHEPHPILIHLVRRRVLNGLENIQNPEFFTPLFHKFSKIQHNPVASWRNADMKRNVRIQSFSADEQEKIVDLYDRYLTKSPLKHILDLAHTTAELRPSGRTNFYFNNPHQALIGRGEGLTDKKQRLRLHDILDRAESMSETEDHPGMRKTIANIVRGYSTGYMRKSGEETKRLWTGLAKDTYHADTRTYEQARKDRDTQQHLKGLHPSGEIYYEDQVPDVPKSKYNRRISDTLKVEGLLNANLLADLTRDNLVDHLGYSEAKDAYSHIFNLLDHHPNFEQLRRHGSYMSGPLQKLNTVEDSMHGPNYLKRHMADHLGRFKYKLENPKGNYTEADRVRTGLEEIEIYRKLKNKRI